MVGEGTYINTLKAFPQNIEISTTVTYQGKKERTMLAICQQVVLAFR